MALANAIQNARYAAQQITWSDADSNAVNLTDSTLTGFIQDANGRIRAIDGTLELVTAASGIFSWAYGANDVATPGDYLVQFVATYDGNPLPDKTLLYEWTVHEAIDDYEDD